MKTRVGFVGQGFVGKHMADDFEKRGYETVRYSLEKPYNQNKYKIGTCNVIFIAVPTPTTEHGFDFSAVKSALKLLKKDSVAVIKSTILPGTTEKLQDIFSNLYVMHSPEFLREKTAADDTSHPERNIVGIPKDTEAFQKKAELVLSILPYAPYAVITSSVNAECVKYIGNTFLHTKLIFMNMAYDFVTAAGANWETVREAVTQDARIGTSHTQPVHEDGRGAGGHCFIKDFEAFLDHYKHTVSDSHAIAILEAIRNKNNKLLLESQKDLELLKGVYGENIPI